MSLSPSGRRLETDYLRAEAVLWHRRAFYPEPTAVRTIANDGLYISEAHSYRTVADSWDQGLLVSFYKESRPAEEYSTHLADDHIDKFDIDDTCETTYEILDQAGNTSVAKAIMKFEKSPHVDYITMQQTKRGLESQQSGNDISIGIQPRPAGVWVFLFERYRGFGNFINKI